MADSTLTHAYINTSTKTENLLKKGVVTQSEERRKKEKREQSLVTRLTTHREGGRLEGRGERLFFFGSLFRVVLL